MDLMHLRLVTPHDLTDRAAALLREDPYVFDVAVLPGVVRDGDRDLIACDVLTGAADGLLHRLRGLGVDRAGSLVAAPAGMALSERAADAETRLLGPLAKAPVWEQVYARIRAEGTYPPSFYLFLVAAGIIGAVGLLTNSQILIVGAMIVGPEHGAIAAVSLALDRRSRRAARRGLAALAVGFAAAIAVTFAFAVVVRLLELEPVAYEHGLRPVSHLITTPNFYSVVVAVVAGVVGTVSLTRDRASTLLGVFISVTTIPAAAAIGVSCAFTAWDEARGALFQLLLNIAVLIAVGAATLRAQRVWWSRRTQF